MGNRNAVLGSLIAASALCLASTGWAQSVNVGTATGNPGDTKSISVTLSSGGQSIAGTQNDITFDAANAPIAAKANGKPDCAANAAISKEGTTFAFQPAGCSGAACTAVRVLVFSFSNTDVIPDGSELYTCNVAISASAAAGTYPLAVPFSSVSLSDPSGGPITAVAGTDGSVTVGGGGGPTPTPTTGGGGPATPTAQPSPSGPAIIVQQVSAAAGDTVPVNITLFSGGASVAGTQNDITFDANAPVAAKANGKPDCAANTAIGKEGTTFAFQPAGCSGAACNAVRVLVFSFSNTDVIPDGSVLYTCNVAVSASAAAGIHTLAVPASSVSLSDPSGGPIAGSGLDGSVFVTTIGPPVTPPTATATVPGPTHTPTSGTPPIISPTPTRTGGVISPTPTKTPTTGVVVTPATPVESFADEDGCQIGTLHANGSAWLLLVPVALFLMRRRQR